MASHGPVSRPVPAKKSRPPQVLTVRRPTDDRALTQTLVRPPFPRPAGTSARAISLHATHYPPTRMRSHTHAGEDLFGHQLAGQFGARAGLRAPPLLHQCRACLECLIAGRVRVHSTRRTAMATTATTTPRRRRTTTKARTTTRPPRAASTPRTEARATGATASAPRSTAFSSRS